MMRTHPVKEITSLSLRCKYVYRKQSVQTSSCNEHVLTADSAGCGGVWGYWKWRSDIHPNGPSLHYCHTSVAHDSINHEANYPAARATGAFQSDQRRYVGQSHLHCGAELRHKCDRDLH